jgi:hypothetical protein
MMLGEVYQLILRQAQHEVWGRRSRGESAATIANDFGIDLYTVHSWILELGAGPGHRLRHARPSGVLHLTFDADNCQVDDRRLTWPQAPVSSSSRTARLNDGTSSESHL